MNTTIEQLASNRSRLEQTNRHLDALWRITLGCITVMLAATLYFLL